MGAEFFVGRQPIFNRKLRTHAYELLYRDSQGNNAESTCKDVASSQVLFNTLSEIGIERIVGKHLAFVNLTENLLLNENIVAVLPEQCVLEVLEWVRPTEEVVDKLRSLKAMGYTIALDDFVFRDELIPFVELADIIKLDVLSLGVEGVRKQMELLSAYPVKFLAEKVEKPEEFNVFQDLGFDYFQGFFFARPSTVSVKSIPPNKVAILELISKVTDPDVSMAELGEIISRDAALSVKTLKYVNSPAVGLKAEVSSVEQALALLGLDLIRHWVMVMTLSGIDLGEKSPELFVVMLSRAKFCELASKMAGKSDPGSYFTVGLLSAIDVLMDTSLEELIEPLPITAQMKDGLVRHTGEMGDMLMTAIALEQSMPEEISSDLSMAQLHGCFNQAQEWADEVNPDV